MVSVRVRGRVGKDGILRLQVPTEFQDTEVEACVVLNPLAPDGATGATNEAASKGYPPGFFEATAGKWVGELERGEQGEVDQRDWEK